MSLLDWPRPAVRMISFACLSVLVVLAALPLAAPVFTTPAQAHSGHDHGAPLAPLPVTVRPRMVVETDLYQLVAILSGPQRLTLFIDRADSNAPVPDAKVSLLLADAAVAAEPRADGSYQVALPAAEQPGPQALVFRIEHAAGEDLLAGDLERPAEGAQPAQAERQAARPIEQVVSYLPLGLALLVGIGIGLAARRPRAARIGALLLGLAALQQLPEAQAHDGHAHSPVPEGASLTGDLPRRLADGSIFLPKPSQRLLSVLTERAVEGEGQRSVSLLGRVVADPNRSGVVQSINGGRVSAPEDGFRHLGQHVRKGEVLALVTPALPLADQSTLAEKQRELEGAISLAKQKLARLNRLGPGVTPRGNIEDAELEVGNLEQRLASLKQAKIAPEVLTAPIDGVLSTARVVAGQVVAAQDSLFQVVDTSRLWVEALVFDQVDPGAIVDATARTPDGRTMKLAFRGRSRALQAQSTVLQFAIETDGSEVALGQPVTVIARTGARTKGMLMHRGALVRGPAGETVVWEQVEPERFVLRQVGSEPFDGERVLLTGGVKPGDRIVVHGAELLSQVR